ncbi:hypothetical protein LZV00_02950 [Pseudomonas kielensis]|uniref:hypothetical protein n=1 Tax=Pseudomonas kielensis TaxID=2762577 RepID=UPI00223EAF02|nr:hypothetical protein [Pseudomonas kielensis]UZM14772.1 hypothetical protein LZV00_02950 [Pseudomonas kielensis]
MIGAPMPNPRNSIIAELNQKLDQFFGADKTVQEIANGVSAEMVGYGVSAHQDRLKAERARLAPMVKAQTDAGKTVAAAAAELKMRPGRVKLIAHENGFTFSAHS